MSLQVCASVQKCASSVLPQGLISTCVQKCVSNVLACVQKSVPKCTCNHAEMCAELCRFVLAIVQKCSEVCRNVHRSVLPLGLIYAHVCKNVSQMCLHMCRNVLAIVEKCACKCCHGVSRQSITLLPPAAAHPLLPCNIIMLSSSTSLSSSSS